MQAYNYTKANNVDKLKTEIEVSSITIALDNVSSFGTAITITFKAVLSAGEIITLDAIVAAHDGIALIEDYIAKVEIPQFTMSSGRNLPMFSMMEPEGDAATIASHDFTKKQTWYQQSVAVAAQALTSEDNLTFSSPHAFWIDLTHGLMYDEDNVNVGGMYNPVIKVDGSIVTTGFVINYVTGAVVFTSAVLGVVTANYYYATTSYYVIKPNAGKVLSIKTAEVQFTTDVVIAGAFVFEAWVNHPTYGLIPVPNNKIKYKNFRDFITACNQGQGLIPKIGDLLFDVHVFPFDYARPKPIYYSQGVEIRIYIDGHAPVSGQYATATFYVTSEPE
jgi:hypothetical protein